MRSAHKEILQKSLVTTVVAVVGALAVFATIRWAGGEPISTRDWWETTIIPAIVGFPIAVYVFRQAELLREAHQQLLALNAETEEAHRRLKAAHNALAFAATHDGLTGIFNREQFFDILEQEYLSPRPSVLLVIDVDAFKSINDRHGHLAGDEGLKSVARAIKDSVREQDEVGRVGGDEFGVLLRDILPDAAHELAEAIRLRVSRSPVELRDGRRIDLSVSIGGASLLDFRGNIRDVIGYADVRLYDAKRSGRNRVVMRTQDPRPPRVMIASGG